MFQLFVLATMVGAACAGCSEMCCAAVYPHCRAAWESCM